MRIFTTEHDEILRSNYNKCSIEKLREMLHYKYSRLLIDRRAKELGLTNCPAHKKQEYDTLNANIITAYESLRSISILDPMFETMLNEINNLEIRLENLLKK